MSIGLTRIKHVKIPVTDLRHSVSWYRRALDVDVAAEFSEQGTVRGVALSNHEGTVVIALRDRDHCAGNPALTGFDVVAFEVDTRIALAALVSRWDGIGIDHTAVLDNGPYGAAVDAHDPDGTVLRFLADNPIGAGGFLGVDIGPDRTITRYVHRRLDQDSAPPPGPP